MVKGLPAMWQTQVRPLGLEDPLDKETATHASILAWRTPWTEESGGLRSMGSQRVGHDWATDTFIFTFHQQGLAETVLFYLPFLWNDIFQSFAMFITFGSQLSKPGGEVSRESRHTARGRPMSLLQLAPCNVGKVLKHAPTKVTCKSRETSLRSTTSQHNIKMLKSIKITSYKMLIKEQNGQNRTSRTISQIAQRLV